MEKLRKKIFENITNMIAIITAILAIILAIIKLLSYSYWKGYLTYFNISSDYIRLNNDNVILELVFYGILVLSLIYFMSTTYHFFDICMKRVTKEVGVIKKIWMFIKQFLLSVFISAILLTGINVPLLWVSIISFDNWYGQSLYGSLIMAYILEMFTMIAYWLTEHDTRKKKNVENDKNERNKKLTARILLFIVLVSFIVAGLYKMGIGSANQKNEFEVVNNGKYIIAYKFDDKCILLSSDIDNSSIVIKRNRQKIIDIKDIEYEIIKFDSVSIRWED